VRILIIGANGHIGSLAVDYALADGHLVTAFARSHNDAILRPNLTQIVGDVMAAVDVIAAVPGHDCVILAFGAPLSRDSVLHQPLLCETGTRHVVEALRRTGRGRLICMTSLGAGNSAHHGGFLFRNVLAPVMLGRILRDRTAQEDVVAKSGLEDWVIVRPTELSDADAAAVRVIRDLDAELEPTTISRSSVAQMLIGLVSNHAFDRSAITITN
jgi:putative NADH-flavin reductase